MAEIHLRGITWGHSRGYTPLAAAAQRFSELHPGVTISWDKRTLQQFADYPIERLTKDYDLLIIDHPWVGKAATLGCVLALDNHLPASWLGEQAENSIGYSHHSYNYDGHQWALAIDAATPVASCRADLLEQAGVTIPDTWDEVLAIARRGRLAVPAIPIDLLMNFYMFCIAHGSRPFQTEEKVIDGATGRAALETMRELYSLVDEKFFHANPIAVAEYLSATDDYWYCPFAYGYSNYSRDGYANHRLTYSDLVSFGTRGRLRSTIGGTGLAVSAHSQHPGQALAFASWIVSPIIQSTFYVEHGGQPGHRLAWINDKANRLTYNYFYNTLPAMERAYMRPRYDGYLYFQDHGGDPIREYLMKKSDP
ncbi:MAG TPA: extracellular solute-binding protein, partial [Verrucomicrobiae bacterium]|nr:extracellular solute-binding protein [Verrucomicrobiae bacterium]